MKKGLIYCFLVAFILSNMLLIGCYVPASLDPMSRFYEKQAKRIDDQISEIRGTNRTKTKYPTNQSTLPTASYTPTPNFDTQQTVISNWGQPSETFISPSGKVEIFIYNKEYKGHQIAVLAFIGQKLHKIIPMTQKNYQGFRTKLTETQNIATLFGLSE